MKLLIYERVITFLKWIPGVGSRLEKLCRFTSAVLGGERFYLDTLKAIQHVDLVIDVGVYQGTPELYAVFEEKDFYLIDPQPKNLQSKPKIFRQFSCVLGGFNGNRTFYNYVAEGVSSCHTFTKKDGSYKSNLHSESTVACFTLNEFINLNCKGFVSIGLKVDAQGAEFEIFNAMEYIDDSVKWIIVENNVVDRYNTESHFSNVTSSLWQRGFRFLNLTQQTTTYISVAYDTVYLRKNHPIFTD